MNTIVMTGGTSGLGLIAADIFRKNPDVTLLLGARGSAHDALPLDLAKLPSVRKFAREVETRLGPNGSINALVLNAGTSPANADGRTEDGFETAFAVNHLAHYLLLRLLTPRLAEGATVVFTTSGTHDPAEHTPIPPPRHANARLLAHPNEDPAKDKIARIAGGRAYSSSKLCNVLTARAYSARPETSDKKIVVIAYNPGPTPGTGLLREGGFLLSLMWSVPGGPLGRVVPSLNSRQDAGRILADLALGKAVPPPGGLYADFRRRQLSWKQPSELARRDDVMTDLWRDSAALAGLQA